MKVVGPVALDYLKSLMAGFLALVLLSACGAQKNTSARSDPVQNAMVSPPWEAFTRAGPGASQEMDLDLLNGSMTASLPPQYLPDVKNDKAGSAVAPASLNEDKRPEGALAQAPPHPAIASAPNSGEDKGDQDLLHQNPSLSGQKIAQRLDEAGPDQPEGSSAEKPNTEKSAAPKATITAVTVLPVTGGTAKGDAELTAAMHETLTKAGWQVLTQKNKNALTIQGKVTIDPAQSGQQKVSLLWLVQSPQGEMVGDIRQSNAVPAGSLNSGWGDTAIAVTEAAATGIFELINKLRAS